MTAPADERVVLLDEAGRSVGSAPKATSHSADTPLHLAFSCYVFDGQGRLLVTQRAQDKTTFPGVWTNTFCGHPGPDEDVFEAVRRRAEQELGLTLEDLRLVLPTFRYEATMGNGVRENELCPVFTARAAGDPRPDPAEVADVEWVPWRQFRDEVMAGRREVSLWCALQVPELAGREEADGTFVVASPADLPAAARPGPR
jgi:isopentenyl-diphosphate delta-isomerase